MTDDSQDLQRIPRTRTLTEADMLALKEMMHDHSCRFNNVSREDMGFLMDLLTIYKETRSEVIKWVVKGAIYLTMLAVVVIAYVKYGRQ